jgi:ABC-type branched-subunit amino acid transport system substrate-binding protein
VAAVGAVSEGIKVRIAAVNAAGGVKMGDGKTRTIELVIQDDGIDPQRTLTNVRKMVEQGEVFSLVGISGTPNNQAIGRYVEQNKVPNLFMYSGVQELPEGRTWMIGLVPSFTTEAAAFADYLKANKPDAKVAILFVNTETGQTFKAGFTEAIKGSRLRLVAEQPVTPVDPTIDTQMSNLKASGADTLVIIAPPRQGAQAVRVAAESGWNPTTMLSYIASSISVLKPAGLANAKGLITSQFVKPVDAPAYAADAGVRRYLADHASAKPRFDKSDSQGQIGYVTGEALVRVLEAMKQPTRQAMLDAARNMNKVELGMLLPGITLTTKGDADVYPIETLQLMRFDGENYQPIGGLSSFEGRTPKH